MKVSSLLINALADPRRAGQRLAHLFVRQVNKVMEVATKARRMPLALMRRSGRLLPGRIRDHLLESRIVMRLVRTGSTRSTARRYVDPTLSRTEFLEHLRHRGVRYVLLRWWEAFPRFPAGEDMDILLEDGDLALIDDLFVRYRTNMPCDTYTVSGSGGGDYAGLPYFSPGLAEGLLAERRLWSDTVYVPTPLMHLASMAYHAVYHKGRSSGLRGFGPPVEAADPPDHDYPGLLAELASESGVEVDISCQGLSDWLREQGFAPSLDTLRKLIQLRPELQVLDRPLSCDVRGGELCVLVVRERTEEDGRTAAIQKVVGDLRFETLASIPLSALERTRYARSMRGGRWDRGPHSVSGGLPARLLVCFDYHPQAPSRTQSATYPWITNRRLLGLKKACRDAVNAGRFLGNHYNGVHSADNEAEAFEYLAIAAPERTAEIMRRVEQIRERIRVRWPVCKVLSTGRRSIVELIRFEGGGYAVKKTFRLGQERFYERELHAAKVLAQELDFIPPFLTHDEGMIVIPYYCNVLKDVDDRMRRSIMWSHRLEVFRIIREMHARGLAYINFTPENVIITPEGKFIAIDYEFLQAYRTPAPSIEESYEVRGVDPDFTGDLPIGWHAARNRRRMSSFRHIWEPYVGSWADLRRLAEDRPTFSDPATRNSEGS